VVSDEPSESAWYDARLALITPDGSGLRTVYRPQWQVQCPRLSPDGRHVAFVEGSCSDRVVVTGVISVLTLESEEVVRLAVNTDAAQVAWIEDGRIAYAGRSGLDSNCGLVSLGGEVDEVWSGPAQLGMLHLTAVSVDRAGTRFAASKDAPGEPPEVCILNTAPGARTWRPLTSLNDALRDIRAPRVESLKWNSSDGLEIEGLVLLPAEAERRPLPMVVIVHGGPTLNWTYSFAPGYLGHGLCLANAGYAVLLPNPRGSSGYGQDFARANLGDLGGGDFQDIVAGVEACVEAGIADGVRVGITGVSGGGLMSAWAVTQTDRFAAAIPVSCVSNWLSFHNTANIGRFDELFLQADPYDPTGNYAKLSPVMHSRAARTPTLIMHGDLDLVTPKGQAQEFYQALVDAGCTTELVIYPREGHGHAWIERPHLDDCWQRMREWFDRYLGFADATVDPAGETEVVRS
jgi:dipeptidyl aminopeptidase/acylaminoacyl peptidase